MPRIPELPVDSKVLEIFVKVQRCCRRFFFFFQLTLSLTEQGCGGCGSGCCCGHLPPLPLLMTEPEGDGVDGGEDNKTPAVGPAAVAERTWWSFDGCRCWWSSSELLQLWLPVLLIRPGVTAVPTPLTVTFVRWSEWWWDVEGKSTLQQLWSSSNKSVPPRRGTDEQSVDHYATFIMRKWTIQVTCQHSSGSFLLVHS